jgi:hypothetical protein
MAQLTYEKETPGRVVIEPYNFISEGGKLWDRIKGVAECSGRTVRNVAERRSEPGREMR